MREIFPPPRFATREDAVLYMDCLKNKTPFPPDKWIHPYIMVGDLAVINPKYRDAPYEEAFIYENE